MNTRHIKSSLALLLLNFYFFVPSSAQWQQTAGPSGGNIGALVINAGNIFAGIQTSGVFKSPVNSISWSPVNNGLPNIFIEAMVTNGAGDVFVGGYGDGVYRSMSNGASWTKINTGLTSLKVTSLESLGTSLFTGTNGGGVFRSNDNGGTWTSVKVGMLDSNIFSFATTGSDLFAGTADGVYMSSDSGDNWMHVNSNMVGIKVTALTINGSAVYAGNDQFGVYVSVDNGVSWNPCNSGLGSLDISCLLAVGPNLFAGTKSGDVYLTANGGLAWNLVANGLPGGSAISCMVVNGSDVFAGTVGSGVYMTSNTGSNWTATNDGLAGSYVEALASIGPNLFAGTVGLGMFVTSDGGVSWTSINNGLTNTNVISLATIGTNLFASTFYGTFLSSDNGASWNALTGLPNQVQTLIAKGTDLFAGTMGSGIFVSNNNGATWSNNNTGLTDLTVYCFATMGGNLFAGTNSGVFLSSDNGLTWSAASSGLSKPIVQTLGTSGTNLFAATNGGIYLSKNNGTSWTLVNSSFANKIVYSLVSNGNALFAGTDGEGVFISTDDGYNWTAVNNGLTLKSITSLLVFGSDLFAGTFYGGVFKSFLNNTVNGTVSTKAGPVNSGYVKLYRTRSGIRMLKADSVQVDSFGKYTFNNIFSGGGYTIYANCTSNYPLTTPTYADSAALWDSSKVVAVTLNQTVTENIKLIEFPVASGSGKISGTLTQGLKFLKMMAAGDPIKGIDVGLGKKPKSHVNIIAHSVTDNNGTYAFNNIPPGDYKIFIEIPGLPMDSSYDISVTTKDTIFTNRDYEADSSKIYIDDKLMTSNKVMTTRASSLKIYPNPFSRQTVLEMEMTKEAEVHLVVYNALGQEIAVLENTSLEIGSYKYALSVPCQGVYFLRTIIGGEQMTEKIIAVE